MTIEDFIPDIATELTNCAGLPREVAVEGALRPRVESRS